jgi:hypothetical protein
MPLARLVVDSLWEFDALHIFWCIKRVLPCDDLIEAKPWSTISKSQA